MDIQYKILVLVVLALILYFFIRNSYSYLRKRRFIHGRNSTSLETMHDQYFSDIPEGEFNIVWCAVSSKLGIDAGILRPEDTIKDLMKLYPIPEHVYDDLEEVILEYGKDSNFLSDEITIEQIVRNISNL